MRLLLSFVFALTALSLSPTGQAQATCELTPLTLPLFDGTPVAQLATPSASPAAQPLEMDEATEVLEMYVACTNTGDPTLIWAMFTPRWFSQEFADSEQHYLPAFEYQIATGHAKQVTNPLELITVDEIARLDDGRVAVTASFSSGPLSWTDKLILVNAEGQWLIDEVELVSPAD